MTSFSDVKSLTFVCSEYFGWGGLYGGFGALTKTLAENLVKRGIEVHVLTPRRRETSSAVSFIAPWTKKRVIYPMKDYGEINGVKIHSFNSRIKVRLGIKMREFPELPDTQIFHSQASNQWHNFFRKKKPDAVHLVTEQDPRPLEDLRECYFPLYPEMETLTWRLKFEFKQRLCTDLCQNVDMVYVQAKYIADKVRNMFGLDYTPPFLPNPITIPKNKIEKADVPTVLFLGRWDPIKRPDIMLQIAEKMPNVQFTCCGVANPEFKHYFDSLVKKAGKLENVHYMGFVVAEKKDEVLKKSWILLNTSTRECLPISFLEAGAYEMAIVSPNNPDDFASNFGHKIRSKENITEYVDAINTLITGELWREKGAFARTYVQENHELNHVIDRHLEIYNFWIEDL